MEKSIGAGAIGAGAASGMIAQSEYLSLLKHVLQSTQLALFHESCKQTINFFEVAQTKMEPANPAPGKNQIILDNSVYDVSEASWNEFRLGFMMRSQSPIILGSSDLYNRLQEMLQKIELSDQHGFITFFTELFYKANGEQDKDAVKFMYSYIHYLVAVNPGYKSSFKHAKFAIQTGEMICQYICHKSPQLWRLVDVFTQPILDEGKKDVIMTATKLIVMMEKPADDSDVVQFFTNLGITNRVQRHTIIAYLENLLYTSSNMKVLQLAYDEDKRIRYHNKIKNVLAKMGSYLIQRLVDARIFKLKTYYKRDHQINYYEPYSEIISQLLRGPKPICPFFTTGQVTETREIVEARKAANANAKAKKPKTAEEVKNAREITRLNELKTITPPARNEISAEVLAKIRSGLEIINDDIDNNNKAYNNKNDDNNNNKEYNNKNDDDKDDYNNNKNDDDKDDENDDYNNNVNDKNKGDKTDESMTPEEQESARYHYYDILMKRMTTKIKQSERITIKINDGVDFFEQNTFYSKYSIDYDYLCWFLQLLLNQTPDKLITQRLLLSLYDLNYDDLEHLTRQDNTTDYFIVEICKEALNFESLITASKLKEQLIHYAKKNYIEYKYRAVIEKYVDKMCQRKYFFINLIQECILYSPFKYFIFTDFIDTRGRQYINTPFLNINNNPMAKSFVKLYKDSENIQPNSKELDVIKGCLGHKETQKKMDNVLKQFKQSWGASCRIDEMQATYTYIASLLNDITPIQVENIINSLNEFKKDVYNEKEDLELLTFIAKHVKKHKNLCFVHSLIYFEHRRTVSHRYYMANYVDKDATSSGLQMMSMLFRSIELAKICNLSGKDNCGIYQMTTEYCRKCYIKHKEMSESILKGLALDLTAYSEINEGHKIYNTAEFKHISANFKQCFIMWVNIDTGASSCLIDLIGFLVTNLHEMMGESFVTQFSSCIDDTIINANLVTLVKNLLRVDKFKPLEKELKLLMMMRYVSRLHYITLSIFKIDVTKPNSFFHSRNLFKNLIMTTVYMSTAYGRRDSFKDIYRETQAQTYVPPDELHLQGRFQEIISFLDYCGNAYLLTIPDVHLIKQFADAIPKDKPITLHTQFFTITFNPKKQFKHQISCQAMDKKRGPRLTITQNLNDLDDKKLYRMLLANVAHTMDADIVHRLIRLVHLINQRLAALRADYPFQITVKSNHDCFVIIPGYLIEILIEDCYRSTMTYDFMPHMLKTKKFQRNTTDGYINGVTPINSYFIK